MQPGDIERAINFLLQHQGELDSRLAQLSEAQTQTNRAIVAFAGYLQQSIELSTARMDKLAAAQAETTERLNTFIVVVEKYITSHGDGAHPSHPA